MSATFIADLFALFVNFSTYLSISHRIYNFEGENMNKLIILTISLMFNGLNAKKTGSVGIPSAGFLAYCYVQLSMN